MDKEGKGQKQKFIFAKLGRYGIWGSVLLLASCTSSPLSMAPNFLGGENRANAEVKAFIFDGEDFVEKDVKPARSNNEESLFGARPAVKGYSQTHASYGQRENVVYKAPSLDKSLAREYLAHKRAIEAAKAAERAAAQYAKDAQKFKIASKNAQGSALEAGRLKKKQLQQAALLQEKARKKARIAKMERARAKKIREKAEQTARAAQQNNFAARKARQQAKRNGLYAQKSGNKARKLRELAQKKAAIQARKMRMRDQAYQSAFALEHKAKRRTLKLRQALKKNNSEREKALRVARLARLRAKRLAQGSASQRVSLDRAQRHERALKHNR